VAPRAARFADGRFQRLFAVCLMAVVNFPSISDSDDLLHFSLLHVPNRQSGGFGSVGMMGFGSRGKVHHKRLFGVSDDKPVIITVVDEEHKIREVLPEIRGMIKEGLVVLLDAEVVEPADAASQ
jgi:hypothetical protein